MTTEDFYKLKIGQKIWVEGKEQKIDTKVEDESGCFVWLDGGDSFLWEDICEAFSLEPPKQKTRYWQWKLDTGHGLFRNNYYMSEDGIGTSGDKIYGDWDSFKKTKIEDDFVDV